jgi:hypothetical protein
MNDDAADLASQGRPAPISPDLTAIRELAMTARAAEKKIADLNDEIKRLESVIDRIMTRDLPEKMDAIGLRNLTIAAKGNMAAFTVTVKTMYSASIAASWDQERRRAAFDWLDSHGHGSLIKTDVVTTFPREHRSEVSQFVGQLDRDGRSYMVKEGVHSATLGAWLREMVERGSTPPLDVIGGYVERQAVIKEERE